MEPFQAWELFCWKNTQWSVKLSRVSFVMIFRPVHTCFLKSEGSGCLFSYSSSVVLPLNCLLTKLSPTNLQTLWTAHPYCSLVVSTSSSRFENKPWLGIVYRKPLKPDAACNAVCKQRSHERLMEMFIPQLPCLISELSCDSNKARQSAWWMKTLTAGPASLLISDDWITLKQVQTPTKGFHLAWSG